MQDSIQPYSSYPLWVRLVCGRGWFSASRRELKKIECFALGFSLFGGLIWLGSVFFNFPDDIMPVFNIKFTDFFGLCSIGCLLCAYRFSITIRVGDRYQLWQSLEQTQSHN